MSETCLNCYWWEHKIADSGACHGVPPKLIDAPPMVVHYEPLELNVEKLKGVFDAANCGVIHTRPARSVEVLEASVFPTTKSSDYCPNWKER